MQHVPLAKWLVQLSDAIENLLIADGMGWDLEGVMENGTKCICQHGRWGNAFGERNYALNTGDRLTVKSSIRVGGISFYEFVEAPEGNYYMSHGFTPLRNYN